MTYKYKKRNIEFLHHPLSHFPGITDANADVSFRTVF
jgi:hypothetical protein